MPGPCLSIEFLQLALFGKLGQTNWGHESWASSPQMC